MRRTIDATGFHTAHGERFWSRPLYGPNRRSFVPTGELPHAAFLWIDPQDNAFVRCAHFLPGVVSPRGTKWLYEAADVTATYDPGMMRFAARDPAWEGELDLTVVPLASGDGYAIRVTATQPVELAFAFGGFLCIPDKDDYQGTTEPSRDIAAQFGGDATYTSLGEDLTVATLADIVGIKGSRLGKPLKVALVGERKTQFSRHAVQAQNALAELLKRSPGTTSIPVHRLALGAGESLHLVAVVSDRDFEAEVQQLRGHVAETFERCKRRVEEISGRVRLQTPDTLLDLAARSLCHSMDALWYPPVFLHGPIRWGWPGLAGWRMAYGADVCGTYDRVASHCKYYGDHRGTGAPESKPHLDPATSLTKQTSDSLLFSRGSVVNWGVYNMTEMWLSFIAHHYAWTGDADYLRSMWPAIREAVEFQKRVFHRGDSLYENYANTYITDAHWHNGGQCTQASAYTYRGNLLAAEAARLVGQSPEPFLSEAARIREAMNRVLWIKDKGVYAEWKDTLAEKLLHPEPELGSVYLPIDCGVADPFQAYQMLRFTEWGLPNHVFEEVGPQPFDGLYRQGSTYEFPQPLQAREVKSSNWRPIILTVYECSPGEQMDTARAYYKLGLNDRAFPLVKAVLRSMVNLTATGGLVIRDRNAETFARAWGNGDVDHCDTLGPSLQCIAEGVFGIHPWMAEKRVEIQPGFPSGWDHAQIALRDVAYSFRRQGATDTYSVTTSQPARKRLRLVMRGDGATAKIDGHPVAQSGLVAGIGHPFLELEAPEGKTAEFSVTYSADPLPSLKHLPVAALGRTFDIACLHGVILELKDPQGVFSNASIAGDHVSAAVGGSLGHHTAFCRVKGKATEFWLPVDVEIRPALEVVDLKLSDDAKILNFAISSHAGQPEALRAEVQCAGKSLPIQVEIAASGKSGTFSLPLEDAKRLAPGRNPVRLSVAGRLVSETQWECWDLLQRAAERKKRLSLEPVDLSAQFNDDLALVHAHEYVSPRSPFCSLQIASDLYREWCSQGNTTCGKLDLGILREAAAGSGGILTTGPGIPFRTAAQGKNIVFVSQWDNFPRQVKIPIARPASHAYLLMASVTNPMQSGVVNGRIVFHLAGDKTAALELVNPQNLGWCIDHYPNRYGPLHLVKPTVKLGEHVYATLYSVPLPEAARVDSVTLEAVSNESVIGLLGLTLCRVDY